MSTKLWILLVVGLCIVGSAVSGWLDDGNAWGTHYGCWFLGFATGLLIAYLDRWRKQ